MGPLLHRCTEVHEPIKLSFGMVSGVGPGIDVLDGVLVHMPQGEGAVSGVFRHLHPIRLNGKNTYCSLINVFDSCVKS